MRRLVFKDELEKEMKCKAKKRKEMEWSCSWIPPLYHHSCNKYFFLCDVMKHVEKIVFKDELENETKCKAKKKK